MGYVFEWDQDKSKLNEGKHGISFYEAQNLWLDPFGISYPARKVLGEPRFFHFALYNEKLWAAIYTTRNSKIRIISVRRVRIMKGNTIMAKKIKDIELDKKFDDGEDISEFIDIDNPIKRVNVDFPIWMLDRLDEEAKRLGINRQALIKTWLNQVLEKKENSKKSAS